MTLWVVAEDLDKCEGCLSIPYEGRIIAIYDKESDARENISASIIGSEWKEFRRAKKGIVYRNECTGEVLRRYVHPVEIGKVYPFGVTI